MTLFERSSIPLGSTVLVTGVNGFVGSHVADQLLNYGFKVRGSVRDVKRCSWLSDQFDDKYGKNRFELFQVGNLTDEGVFDDAVKGKIHPSAMPVCAERDQVWLEWPMWLALLPWIHPWKR